MQQLQVHALAACLCTPLLSGGPQGAAVLSDVAYGGMIDYVTWRERCLEFCKGQCIDNLDHADVAVHCQ
jgi:hypothetical protein